MRVFACMNIQWRGCSASRGEIITDLFICVFDMWYTPAPVGLFTASPWSCVWRHWLTLELEYWPGRVDRDDCFGDGSIRGSEVTCSLIETGQNLANYFFFLLFFLFVKKHLTLTPAHKALSPSFFFLPLLSGREEDHTQFNSSLAQPCALIPLEFIWMQIMQQ